MSRVRGLMLAVLTMGLMGLTLGEAPRIQAAGAARAADGAHGNLPPAEPGRIRQCRTGFAGAERGGGRPVACGARSGGLRQHCGIVVTVAIADGALSLGRTEGESAGGWRERERP